MISTPTRISRILKHMIFLIAAMIVSDVQGQQVEISTGINIRNDFSYFLLGRVEDNILLYRDKGFEQKLVAFDTNMQYKWEQELRFDTRKIRLFGVLPRDSTFNVYFGFKDKGEENLKINAYSPRGELIDSNLVYSQDNSLLANDFQFIQSEDKSKSMLYFFEGDNDLRIFGMDNDSLRVYWEDNFEFNNTNLSVELRGAELTNEGHLILLLEKNNINADKEHHSVEIVVLYKGLDDGLVSAFSLENKISQDIKMSIDNYNDRVAIAGLYNEKKSNWSQGVFHANVPISQVGASFEFRFYEFGDEILYDVYGRDASKRQGLTYFQISDVVWRRDGGLLLIAEMQREFSRRSNYDTAGRTTADYYGIRGWTDYYNEDVVIISLNPDGSEHWKKVLYKKQFSQDDGGVFSSYFLFKTPSRLRLIFNDEIRNNNTVSEYLINPIGKYKRESLLSTEYQKLKLRFRDAMQLSSSEMLVPSERSNNLSLVKITY